MKSKERKSNSEPSADSGLDLETKFFLGHAQRRSFSVDIPSYRTTYLKPEIASDKPRYQQLGFPAGFANAWLERELALAAVTKTKDCWV